MKSFKICDFCLSTMVVIKADEIFAVFIIIFILIRLDHGILRFTSST